MNNTLLDGTGPPTVRETIVRLMTQAYTADLAIANVRLAAIDLQGSEIRAACQTRLLIAQLDAAFPADAEALVADATRLAALERLQEFVASGRLEVRCAALQRWVPDFSIYRFDSGSALLLLGAHYFQALPGSNGNTLTAAIVDQRMAERAERRFQRLWQDAYDVLPTIQEILSQAINGRSLPARSSA